ncbi:MAG: dihydroorotate dehydrogenase electron transfer subunit [Tissierellia bacterium]|nr:dihydroorotate dehydrogenase electron transfer subunit [Tissierellia bacterium]
MSAYKWFPIETIQHLNDEVYTLSFRGEFPAKPGQFYMLKINTTNDPLLGRPISVSDVDGDRIVFLIQVLGRGTAMMQSMRPGDKIGLFGPLGNGFRITEGKTALFAGTAGIAPLLYLAKNLPTKPDLYAGFRSSSYYTEEFREHVDEIYIATEDGSEGYRGYALDLLDANAYEKVYICGPMPMIVATMKKFPEANLEVSLEARMGCGFGACLSCNTRTHKGGLRICKEGPVFDAKELIL